MPAVMAVTPLEMTFLGAASFSDQYHSAPPPVRTAPLLVPVVTAWRSGASELLASAVAGSAGSNSDRVRKTDRSLVRVFIPETSLSLMLKARRGGVQPRWAVGILIFNQLYSVFGVKTICRLHRDTPRVADFKRRRRHRARKLEKLYQCDSQWAITLVQLLTKENVYN